MSEYSDIDLRAELARIDRDRAETAMLGEEARKFAAEQHKLSREAEEMKLWRDWRFAWVIAASLVASIIGGLIARAIH